MSRALYCGLDLGQANDYSALVVVEQTVEPEAERGEYSYAVRHLHRWKLGTSYPAIVADLSDMFSTQLQGSTLVIDGTGVGRAVVDMVRDAKLHARVKAFSITCGQNATEDTVPKKDLVAAVQAALQTRRLKIAKQLPLAEVLAKEIEMFRVKVTSDRNETFSAFRERDHDDLLLAMALAVWFGESCPAFDRYHSKIRDPLADLPDGTFARGDLPAGVFG